jgi:hypothetical protein
MLTVSEWVAIVSSGTFLILWLVVSFTSGAV